MKKVKGNIKTGEHTTRAFASFQNKEHQASDFKKLFDALPRKNHKQFLLYLGMMDSTIAEGFEDDKVKEKK
jgi:hypothetical protein